jgi:hypothetical protein
MGDAVDGLTAQLPRICAAGIGDAADLRHGAVGLGITLTHLREAGWRPLAVAFLAA